MSSSNDSEDFINDLVNCGYPNILWPYEYTQVFDAWEKSSGSPTVTVAVIDNGLYIDHEDIGLGTDNYSNVWYNLSEKYGIAGLDDDGNQKTDDFVGWDFINSDNSIMHEHYVSPHGTRMVGIIGAKTNNAIGVYGIAGGSRSEGVKLMGLKVVASNGVVQSALVYQAINYAVENGARIINMSFGGPDSYSSWEVAIQDAYSSNVILVASAGNYGCNDPNTCILYPARYPEVIAVGATEADFGTLVHKNPGGLIWDQLNQLLALNLKLWHLVFPLQHRYPKTLITHFILNMILQGLLVQILSRL